ncbi:MAG: hypothetical protein IIY23_02925 [Erysipelotrichaceae bacterium]|nr:hypothetical protein [Erysipelotrichaceae bacterium]
MKRMIIICLLLSLFCGVSVHADTKEDTMDIELKIEHGRVRLEWPEFADASYRITLKAVGEDTEELYHTEIVSNTYYAEEIVAYCCLENGFPDRMCFLVECVVDDEVKTSGQSDLFDPRDVFPEKETLHIGEDVRTEDIKGFYWLTNGPYVEANQRIDFYRSGDDYIMEGSFYEDGKEKKVDRKLSEDEWIEFLSIISQGEIHREHVMDPDIEVLDVSVAYMKIDWEGMSDADKHCYVFAPADREALLDWLKEKGDTSLDTPTMVGIGLLGAMVLGALMVIFKGSRRFR